MRDRLDYTLRRVSTKEQTKNLSLPAQRKACRQYCEDNGWTVDPVFVERDQSVKAVERTGPTTGSQ